MNIRNAIATATPMIPMINKTQGSSGMNCLANRVSPYITSAAMTFAAQNNPVMTKNVTNFMEAVCQ